MTTKINKLIFIIIVLYSFKSDALTQSAIESPYLTLNRGQLWQSVYYGKIGPNFSNWGRKGIGLDWPGFDESMINTNIGGSPSHLATGGFWIGCKKSKDSVLAVEDWSIFAGTITADAGSKYIVKEHRKLFTNGGNYWLKSDPAKGEEVIRTQWELNKNYTNVDDREHQLPLRVTRTVHQWNGSKRDENYIIYEYVFKNISPEIKLDTAYAKKVVDTLYNFYALLSYAIHSNSRSWSLLYPSLTSGARNTWYFYEPTRRMLWGKADNYLEEPTRNLLYGRSESQGIIVNDVPQGEWLAPGHVGVKLLYSSPDTTKTANRINQYGWSAALNSIDQAGPFTGIPGTNEKKYEVLQDIRKCFQFVSNSGDATYMRRSRMWSMMSLGPWNILPGDSIVIAIAEIVDGVDYSWAVDTTKRGNTIGKTAAEIGTGSKQFLQSVDKAQFTYDNKLRHPNPPAAPSFTVDFYRDREKVIANQLEWAKDTESLPDPDDNIIDLVGYKVYRSAYLPIGPWDSIATIYKGDNKYFNSIKQKYIYVDSNVQIGTNYYYSLTAFDTGRTSWARNLTAKFPETNSNRVPGIESSIFANKTFIPFRATIAPYQTLNEVIVVPNPYISTEDNNRSNEIQFNNIPNPCTIRIYSLRGDLIKTINVGLNSGGSATWNQITDYGLFVKSGMYIYHIESPGNGKKIGKLAIIR